MLILLAGLTLSSASPELRTSLMSKLEYDLRYFESVDKLASRGQRDNRFSTAEWPKEVSRARVNLPILRRVFSEWDGYLAGKALTLPPADATFRVYANLVAVLNMLQARDRGNMREMLKLGQKVVIDGRQNLGRVVGDRADYYLTFYKEYYFLMAEASYRLGQDDEAVRWFARIQADADVQKLQAEMKKQTQLDPKAQRLVALRAKPVVVAQFSGATDPWVGSGLLEVVTADMVQYTDLLVVERAQLDKVLRETELAQAGVTSEGKAAELGKKLSAGTVLTGSYKRDGQNIVLDVKLIATEDAVTLAESHATLPEKTLFAAARAQVLKLFVDIAWLDGTLAAEAEQQRAPEPGTIKQLMEARLLRASKSKEARALYAKAMKDDPAYARLFEDLKSDFSDVSATVAVLPFVNIAGDGNDAWMLRGVVEALSADLPKMGFTVVERERMGDLLREDEIGQVLAPDRAKQVGEKSGADFLVLGSLLHQGTQIRIDCRFVDVRTGVVAFSTTVEDRQGDYMALLQGLSVQISERFNAKLGEDTLKSLTSKKMSKEEFEKFMRQELSKDRLRVSMKPTSVERGPSRAPFWVAVAGASVGAAAVVSGFILADRFGDTAAYNHALVVSGDPSYARARDDAARNATAFSIVGYVGLGLTAASVAYLIYDEIAQRPTRLRVVPEVGTKGAGLSVSGAF